jgi:hypothetical protein
MALETYNQAFPITFSDTVNIRQGLTGAVQCTATATTGLARVVFQDDTTADIYLGLGVILPLKVKRINSTGTTITTAVALYQSAPNS